MCCGAGDIDVRAVLHRELRAWHPGGDTLFVDELDLGGVVRVDTAAINSALWGYEIKSARDTLRRPPQQVEVYSKVCDHAALLVAENHREHAAELLPSWWAMYVVTGGPEVLELTPVATGGPNPGVDPLATAQLLCGTRHSPSSPTVVSIGGFGRSGDAHLGAPRRAPRGR